MTVRVVLDPPAVVAYARGSAAVGELIMTVTDDRDEVGVPVTCLAEAYGVAKGVEVTLLEHLSTALSAVALLPLESRDIPTVGRLSRRAGLAVAHAVVVSARANAYVATAEGALLRRLVDDDRMIIEV